MKQLVRPWWRAFAWTLLLAVASSPAGAAPETVTGRVVLVDPAARGQRHADNSSAVVWLTPLNAPPPASPVAQRRFRVVQRNKQFRPHLLVVPVGAIVDFPNLDPFFHNVFSLFEGKRFDLGLYEAGASHAVRFDRAGVSYLFCNIHPQMSAVVVALATPYYGASNPAGDVTIPNVPDGRYRLSIWQERADAATLQAASREISVSRDASSFGPLSVTLSVGLIANHKNKYDRDYKNPNPQIPLYEQR